MARDLSVSYRTVWNHTKDIKTQKILSRDLIEATAQKYDVMPSTVYYWTKDIPGRNCGWPGIQGKTLDLLKELVANGFLLSTGENVHRQFLTLRKYSPPSIVSLSMGNKSSC